MIAFTFQIVGTVLHASNYILLNPAFPSCCSIKRLNNNSLNNSFTWKTAGAGCQGSSEDSRHIQCSMDKAQENLGYWRLLSPYGRYPHKLCRRSRRWDKVRHGNGENNLSRIKVLEKHGISLSKSKYCLNATAYNRKSKLWEISGLLLPILEVVGFRVRYLFLYIRFIGHPHHSQILSVQIMTVANLILLHQTELQCRTPGNMSIIFPLHIQNEQLLICQPYLI